MAKGRKTGGRLPGSPNVLTAALKDMILQALSDAGGVAYLARQAEENPGPFLALVGKVLPLQLNHTGQIALPAVHYHDGVIPIPIDALLTPASKTV